MKTPADPRQVSNRMGTALCDCGDNMYDQKTIDRFYQYVHKGPGCWEWVGGPQGSDYYGIFWHRGKNMRANRAMWEIEYGPIPEALCVCHKCDNPRCVNPQHLFLGTNADNSHDMVQKGRAARGSRNAAAKLTEDDVAAIRTEYVPRKISQRKLAAKYGVTHTMIGYILRGDNWKHIR